MSLGFSAQILWRNFFGIQQTLCFSNEQFAHFLEISPAILQTLCKNKTTLPLNIAVTLSEKLMFDLEDFLEKELDMDAIFSEYFKLDKLPERYRHAAFSRARTLIHIFDYIEKKQGKLRKNIILRKFQTNGEFLSNPDNLLNVHFMTDLTEHLHSLGYTQEDFFQMGQSSVHLNSRAPVMDLLKEAKSLRNGFEIYIENVSRMFDRNCDYKIEKLTSEKMVLAISPDPKILDALKVKTYANEHLCHIKRGICSTIPLYLGLKQYVPVKKTSSIYDGAQANIFEVDLTVFTSLGRNFNSNPPAIYQ